MENYLTRLLNKRRISASYEAFSERILPKDLEENVNLAKIKAKVIMGELNTGKTNYPDFGTRAVLDFAKIRLSNHDKDSTRKENDRSLETLNEDSELVFLIHGLSVPGVHLDGRYFMPLRKTLFEQEIKNFAIDYNDQAPFKEYCEYVQKEMENVLKIIGKSVITHAIGHSTGADILKYLTLKNYLSPAIQRLNKVVLAAPTTNGKFPHMIDKLAFGSKVDYCNPKTSEGQEILNLFTTINPSNPITIASTGDCFIPLEVALDMAGRNLIIKGAGHLAATGCNYQFNQIYTTILEN